MISASSCKHGHPYPESRRPGRLDCAICHREQQLARDRRDGVVPKERGLLCRERGHEFIPRYGRGVLKGCLVCHQIAMKNRYHADPQSAIAAAKAWQKEHREERRIYFNAWRAANRASSREYRAVGDQETLKYARMILNDPCNYCGASATEVDHIVAIRRGGTSTWENLAPACRNCNVRKFAKPLLLFLLVD